MTHPSDEPETAVPPPSAAAAEPPNGADDALSPARSDKSSDSEGKPVRDKLKETRIDAQPTSDPDLGPVPAADQPMDDAPNGSAPAVDQSASGSDCERGRLRKKRSREDFEKDNEADKHTERTERYRRKKSRETSKDLEDGSLAPPAPTSAPAVEDGALATPATTSAPAIEETNRDEHMTSPARPMSAAPRDVGVDSSIKNKRTRDQAGAEDSTSVSANGKPVTPVKDERDSKRPKDEVPSAADARNSQTKTSLGRAFPNTSAASPFAAMSSKPQPSNPADKAENASTGSDEKFRASAFSSFANSTASPFGGLANPAPGSPFSAATGPKLSSFAGSVTPSPGAGGGFGALGSSTKSAFGGSTFGSSLGGGFSSLGAPKSGLSSFATPGASGITGLKTKSERAFGAPGDKTEDNDDSDEDNENEDETEKDATEEERRSSSHLLSHHTETGEEGENTIWAGRAKLYTMDGKGAERSWKERGTGNFKFNITIDEPKKARFVLRADGTHRLLLNAAVTRQMVFGGDSHGARPKDVRLLFNSPTTDGELEMHLLKMKAENAVKLWEAVTRVQETEL